MNLYLAPIHGMTLAFYRTLYAETFGGFDAYYAPFIATTPMRKATSPVFNDINQENNLPSQKLIPQLLGNNGADLRFFASSIAKRGYDEVNWNIGCPFPSIIKKKKGSGILPQLGLIRGILEEVCLDNSYDLSVKMRLGLTNYEEGIEVIELMNDYPIKNVVIHGRLGTQKYEGVVDLDAFEALYRACKHPVIYNGDILSINDYRTIQKRFPAIDDFMLGRGALRNPFLALEIKGITVTYDQRLLFLKTFHTKAYNHYQTHCPTESLLLNKMKEFWTYASHQIDSTGVFLKKIRQCSTLADYKALIVSSF